VLLEEGPQAVEVDESESPKTVLASCLLESTPADLKVYKTALSVLEGCEDVIHLAALLPENTEANVHNSNVALSWNVLRACAELKITRIAQASSANVLTLVYTLNPHYE